MINIAPDEPKFHARSESGFPKLLREIPGCPEGIYVLGELPDDSLPLIAIVGTRNAPGDARDLARSIAFELAQSGVGIVSGLAYGIDKAAHQGALDAGGKTWAVLAHDLHTLYPPTHRVLGEIIKQHGGLISEYGNNEGPMSYRFLERNRIISGLCLAVVLIAVPERSGALNTARHALDTGREVFVVPHSPKNAFFAGSLALLRDGARLVRNAKDILDDLSLDTRTETRVSAPLPSKLHEQIYKLISTGKATTIDTLMNIVQIKIHSLHAILTDLELRDMIKGNDESYTN